MTKKIVLGGVLAGLVLFVWSSIAHMLLPIGDMGVKAITKEDAFLAATKANITESGLYIFPGEAMMAAKSGSKEEQRAAMDAVIEKYHTGPHGILVYHPVGETLSMTRFLAVEFGADIIVGLIAALALVLASGKLLSFAGRVGLVTALGLLGWLSTDVSYWNWYGFPAAYEVGQFLDQVVGMAFAGTLLAFMMRKI